MQMAPQVMPAGLLVTVPAPLFVIVRLTDGIAICHSPRPWVAIRSTPPPGRTAMSNTATVGRPVPYGLQDAPPFVDSYTPTSVPTNRCAGPSGSLAKALTGTSGRPPLIGVSTGVVSRWVTFQTCARAPPV